MGVRGRTTVLLATGALVAACGSDHKSAPSATPTHSTKRAYCIAC
jgi:nitrous oxide reductase accessory protein NosL